MICGRHFVVIASLLAPGIGDIGRVEIEGGLGTIIGLYDRFKVSMVDLYVCETADACSKIDDIVDPGACRVGSWMLCVAPSGGADGTIPTVHHCTVPLSRLFHRIGRGFPLFKTIVVFFSGIRSEL